LKDIVKTNARTAHILDVGGRKSPYTIGIRAQVTIIDLPRDTELQHQLNLGISEGTFDQIHKRRSNIKEVVLGDMTRSNLPDETFDHVVSVEVLEHVEEDDLFVKEVSRVLKRGGVFLMTTPNGDWVENKNPDHKRHYKKRELSGLLGKYFDDVAVSYAVVGGRYRKLGLRSWSAKHPVTTAASIVGNVINRIQSNARGIEEKAAGTHHLIAAAKKY
jgi:ubiquinone/menaquinone biosynthesis C-methylase UbiE